MMTARCTHKGAQIPDLGICAVLVVLQVPGGGQRVGLRQP